MPGANSAIVLDLASLPEAAELLPETLLSLAKAASVALERHHGERGRDPAAIVRDGEDHPAHIVRAQVDDKARRTYDDPQEATEEGAEGVAILVARRMLGRIVFRRLPKGTGADYFMRDPDTHLDDSYERLECSGIGEGKGATSTRLKQKGRQIDRARQPQPGLAIVTNFGTEPIEIMIGSVTR